MMTTEFTIRFPALLAIPVYHPATGIDDVGIATSAKVERRVERETLHDGEDVDVDIAVVLELSLTEQLTTNHGHRCPHC
jgi:hypothetical protein